MSAAAMETSIKRPRFADRRSTRKAVLVFMSACSPRFVGIA